jgi:Flp pilus assembly pilin Flp
MAHTRLERIIGAAVRFGRSTDGQDLLEYGLLFSLVVVVAMGAVATFGNTINNVFWMTIANNF